MFKEIALEKYYRIINHGPCVMITAGAPEETDVTPIAWNMPVNDEPHLLAISVAESHYITELINKTGEFAVNLADKELLPKLLSCGGVSGRKENKIKKFGIETEKGMIIKTTHLKETPAFLECIVHDKKVYEGVVLIVAKVVYAAVKEALFDEYWISDKARIVHHLGGSYFGCLGKRFKA